MSNFIFSCEHLTRDSELRNINDNYCSLTFSDFIFKLLLSEYKFCSADVQY